MRKAVQGPVQAAWRCMGKVQTEAELDACYLPAQLALRVVWLM